MTANRLPLAILGLALAAACGGGEAAAPADGAYTVRAEIVRLPAAAGGELYLRHEQIPDFVGRDGKRSGMMSMVMPFTVGEGVAVEGYEAGDRVVADFEVRWNDRKPLLVTRLEELPAGTRLEFDPAPQPESAVSEPAEAGVPAAAEDEGETPR